MARAHQYAVDSVGHKHLTRLRGGHHPGAEVHRQAADAAVLAELHLASVKAGPQADAERLRRLVQRERAVNRAAGALEGRERAVAGGLDETAPVQRDLLADQRVVAVQDLTPSGVAQLCSPLRRADD